MKTKEITILDEIWADLVKDKAGYKCEHCGIMGMQMEAAHVVGRRHRATRWGCYFGTEYDLCGHCFCHNCHQQYDEHGPREDAIIQKTIGVMRKVLIQKEAVALVAKFQDFDKVMMDLMKERERWVSL